MKNRLIIFLSLFIKLKNALISLLDRSYGTITTTNSMVVTRCNNIKNNYMKKR